MSYVAVQLTVGTAVLSPDPLKPNVVVWPDVSRPLYDTFLAVSVVPAVMVALHELEMPIADG